ncbi:MAG: hypothetical protein JHC74_02120 [Thermoleophilia bacterium]|nr:hypothetical protein [Thermoleophilia bacterium]
METFRALIPRWVVSLVAAFLVVQVALSLGFIGYIKGVPGTRQFNMDSELNLPAWWSSSLLIAAGLVCVGMWLTGSRMNRPSIQWLGIASGFFLLSAEEIAAIHEDVGVAVGGGTENVSVWPLVYAPIAAVFIWMMLRAVRELPRPIAFIAVGGLMSYVGVLVLEVLSLTAESNVTILIEENLEMLGTALMFAALASELTHRFLALYPEPRQAAEAAREMAVEAT